MAFIPITNTVNFNGNKKSVEVLIGKDSRGNLYYDMFIDNSRKRFVHDKKPIVTYPEQNQGPQWVNGQLLATKDNIHSSDLEVNIFIEPLINDGCGFNPFTQDDWDEGKHPRGDDGRFGSGGKNESGESKSNKGEEPFGKAYKEYSHKPEEAIEHLLKVKSGHVPAAINKEGVGDIDFIYGEAGTKGTAEGSGLAHIIRRRNEEGHDGEDFVKQLPEIIKHGKVDKRPEHPNRIYIIHSGREAAIRLDYDGEEKNWLVSAYIQRKP